MEKRTRAQDFGRLRVKRHRSLKKLRLQLNEDNAAQFLQDDDKGIELVNFLNQGADLEQEDLVDENRILLESHCENEENHTNISLNNNESISANNEQDSLESIDLRYSEDDLHQYYYGIHHDSSDDSSLNNSSDQEEESNYNETENILQNTIPPEIEQLREWEPKINQNSLDELLQILRVRLLPTLPKTAKTFLRTVDAKYGIFQMEDAKGGFGEFVYFSMKKSLEDIVNPYIHVHKEIELQVSADGVPLKKSSDDQFWVLSGKIYFQPDVYKVFPIAIFFGTCKPKSAEDYLENFVAEMNELQRDGMYIKGQKFQIRLKCFICDTPAKAFLKNTLGHTGKVSCERCEIVGESVQGRTVFAATDCRERTDDSFRSFRQEAHHHGPTPLRHLLPVINLVTLFVLDPMHLFCNGIMKKLIDYWVNGSLNLKLNVRARQELSRRLESLQSQIPLEFQRKTRSISTIAKWKATELRFFLLYCGPVVLKKLLDDDLYNHFLLLHVATRILCSESFCHIYNRHAKVYLRTFFESMKGFYGLASQTLNAHHLIHVADDVVSMNCNLSRITAFAFESFLGKLKRLLRTPNRCLAQVCRRLFERHVVQAKKVVQIPQLIEVLNETGDSNVTKIRYKEFTLTNTAPNNMVILKNGTIASIRRIYVDQGAYMLECLVWKKNKPLYTRPTSSANLDIWNLYTEPTSKIIQFPLTSVSNKLIKLELSLSEDGPKKVYVIPFLH